MTYIIDYLVSDTPYPDMGLVNSSSRHIFLSIIYHGVAITSYFPNGTVYQYLYDQYFICY